MSVTKQVSLHGNRAFLSTEDDLVAKTHVSGGVNKPNIVLPGSHDVVAIFDDFHSSLVGDTGNIGDTGNVGAHLGGLYLRPVFTDTGNEIKLRQATNGVIRLGPVSQGTQTPAGTNTSLVGRTHAWKGNMGPGGSPGRLRFGVRLKCPGNGTVWNAGSIFAGFADTGVTGAGTFPIYDTGASDTGGIAAVADAVGFLFGENAAVEGIRGVSARGGATGRQTVTLDTGPPTPNVYQVWELELHRSASDTGGTVTFYINGVPKGSITSPLRTSFPLVPYIGIMASDTGAPALDVDWFAASGTRDTGE